MNKLTRTQKSTRPIKVLQFGGGNFLRAYFDWMIDTLNNETDFDGDVLIVKPTEKGDYKSLRDQGGLFHVRTQGIVDGKLVSEIDLVRCIQKVIHPYNEWQKYLESAQQESIKIIVSNTTEAGIKFSVDDLTDKETPKEFPAKLTAWLFERWKHFKGAKDKGTIILPLELIEDNGTKLKDCILKFSDHWSLPDKFKSWVQNDNVFCNTLVDRIVTGYPKTDIDEVFETLGCEDKLLVDAEPYHLLAIEGPEIIKDILPFHKTELNVVFTNDLKQHRDIKVRILNGAHTSMVPMGLINNVKTVGEFMQNEKLRTWLQDLIIKEIIPTLDYPKEQLKKYYDDVMDRFQNPFIEHKLRDISLNSISKFKTRVLPSLLINHERHSLHHGHILQAFAALIAYYLSSSNDDPTPLRDSTDTIGFFKELSQIQFDTQAELEAIVNKVLSKEDYWGQDLLQLDGLGYQLSNSFSRIQITSNS